MTYAHVNDSAGKKYLIGADNPQDSPNNNNTSSSSSSNAIVTPTVVTYVNARAKSSRLLLSFSSDIARAQQQKSAPINKHHLLWTYS